MDVKALLEEWGILAESPLGQLMATLVERIDTLDMVLHEHIEVASDGIRAIDGRVIAVERAVARMDTAYRGAPGG